MVESLNCKCKALSSNAHPTKKENKYQKTSLQGQSELRHETLS
jgi:hypothetical protein